MWTGENLMSVGLAALTRNDAIRLVGTMDRRRLMDAMACRPFVALGWEWDAVSALLEGPWPRAILGGESLHPVGLRSPCAFSDAGDVRTTAICLSGLDERALEQRFRPSELDAEARFPHRWQALADEPSVRPLVLASARRVIRLFERAAVTGLGILSVFDEPDQAGLPWQ